MFKTIHTPTTPICGISSPRRGPSANGSDAWRFGSCGPVRVLDFSLMANAISLSVIHAILHSSQPHRPQTPCYETDVTSDKGVHTLYRQNASKRAKKQIWHGEFLIFSVVVMVTGGVDVCLHVWLRWCNSMGKIHLIFPCVFGPSFYFSLVQSLRCFWPSRLRHTSEIYFHLFMFFPSQPHPPRSPQKKKKLPCAKEHYYLGCPGGPSSTARCLEALDLD